MKSILTILSALLLLASCGGEEKKVEVAEVIRPVQYMTITSGSTHDGHEFSGVAQAEKEANLSFKVGGNVRSLLVKVGDRVRKGQLLATLDASDFSIQVDQSKASYKGAEANMKAAETQMQIAKTTYERIERLYENNSVSISEFDQAKSQYEAAKSQYDAAQTQVTSAGKQTQAANNQVNYTRLYAPYSGIITEQQIELNELVGAGTAIYKISSESRPEVNVGIPETYISDVKKGQEVDITFSVLGDKVYKGRVSEISYATQGGSTYPAIIKLSNADKNIRPGMAATASFDFDHHEKIDDNIVIAPMSAVGEDQSGNFVFLLKADGESYIASRQSVTIGDMSAAGFEIKSGLSKGDKIATAGLRTLLDGMRVKLL